MKIIAIHTHPIQYIAPQLKILGGKLDLLVLYLTSQNVDICSGGEYRGQSADPGFGTYFTWDQPLLSGYNYKILSSKPPGKVGLFESLRILKKAIRHIISFKPEAVLLFNHLPATTICLGLYCSILKIPIFLRTEATDFVRIPSLLSNLSRHYLLSVFYRLPTKIYPISSHGRMHVAKYGVPPEKIRTLLYCPDTSLLASEVARWSSQRKSLRKSFGISDDTVVLLYVGRFAEEKDIFLIPAALSLVLNNPDYNVCLVCAGDGPLKTEFYRRMTASIGDRFIPFGFLNQGQLGKVYSISDALVLPSSFNETWGLVVNEALAYSLTVITSDKVGSTRDLKALSNPIKIFKANDHISLATTIENYLQSKDIVPLKTGRLPSITDFPDAFIEDLKDILGTESI